LRLNLDLKFLTVLLNEPGVGDSWFKFHDDYGFNAHKVKAGRSIMVHILCFIRTATLCQAEFTVERKLWISAIVESS